MAENNFKPFAVGAGANVSSQSDWENLVALSTGFTAGIARSEQINKALRQGTVMASVLGQVILEQTAEDVLDNGDTDALKVQLLAALASLQIDSVYPVGAVLFFAQNKNPNTLFPGTTWDYIGENKTIRLGLQNGTDVLTTGGADTVTIAKSNLPAETLSITGTAASTDLGTKSTSTNGAHSHTWGHGTQKAGGSDNEVGSSTDDGFGTTSSAGDHSHNIELGSHIHSVTGNTENMGGGASLNITNAYVKLMGWYRSA
ncbi:phage baseplate protein [Klebsiella michiganensis]|uniref:phage baseplate protein n=1 Tax=Klebsiella michiganensis TaxID=1134687 RepID=UPI003D005C5C